MPPGAGLYMTEGWEERGARGGRRARGHAGGDRAKTAGALTFFAFERVSYERVTPSTEIRGYSIVDD